MACVRKHRNVVKLKGGFGICRQKSHGDIMRATDSVQSSNLEEIALGVVRQLSERGLTYFKSDLAIETKRDRTLVSEADQAIEQLARGLFAKLTPELGFMGEEFGRLKHLSNLPQKLEKSDQKSHYPPGFVLNSDVRTFEKDINNEVEEPLNLNTDTYWLLDPIDGTVNFIARSPLWSILLALVQNGKPVLGIVALPSLGEVFIASHGNGARWGSLSQNLETFRPCAVREARELSHAHLSCSSPRVFAYRGIESWYGALVADSAEFRTHSDAYGYTRILCGGIDAMVDPIVASYDVAALQVLFDETPNAELTTLQGHTGNSRFRKGSVVAASNKKLSEEILQHYSLFLSKAEQSVVAPRPFEKQFVLSSGVKPFAKAQPESQVWLQGMEAGVAAFRSRVFKAPGNARTPVVPVVEDVSIIFSKSESGSFAVKNGALDAAPQLESVRGVQVRAIVAGGTGLVTSVLPAQQGPQALVLRALELAYEQSVEQGCSPHTEILAARDQATGHFGAAAYGTGIDIASFQQTLLTLQTQQKDLQQPQIQTVQTRVSLSAENRLQLFLDGSQQTITQLSTRVGIYATAAQGEEKRRGMHRMLENFMFTPDAFADVHKEGLQIAQKHAVDLLSADYVPEDIDYDYLAIDADLLGLILHEALGHAAEGDLIETGASGFGENGKMKHMRVAPDWMDIVVDGNLDNCGYNAIDAEGTLALRKAIVRNGMLVDGIHTRQTALEAGRVPDGSARMESVFCPSINRMTSIWIQARGILPLVPASPAESISQPSAETLFQALAKTNYLDGNHGVLFLSGWKGGTATCSNLEFRADVGRVYQLKKGKAPVLMREANFTGIATECFKSAVAAFGPVLCRSIGTCGKDGQGVPTSDGGPALVLFKKDPRVRVIGSGEANDE